MEKIELTVRFTAGGRLVPLEFRLGERIIQVQQTGRQWETEQGRHLLVMDNQDATYHLFFQLEDLSWYWIKDIKPPAAPA